MNILVIGNGFDLAHDLPTKYTDFLDFCKVINCINGNTIKRFNSSLEEVILFENAPDINSKIRTLIEQKFQCSYSHHQITCKVSCIDLFYQQTKQIYKYIENNFWIKYFFKCNMHGKENWIDFESEILNVIKELDQYMDKKDLYQYVDKLPYYFFETNEKNVSISKNLNDYSRPSHSPKHKIFHFKNRKASVVENTISIYEEENKNYLIPYFELKNKITFKQLIKELESELNKMIKAFEIYLSNFIDMLECNIISPDINSINADKVLSFNYTSTFEKIYGNSKNTDYDYIHGKAKSDPALLNNNMVLGINEYLLGDSKDENVNFISFKKFYQRIYKETGNKYKNWLDTIRKEHDTYIDKMSYGKTDTPPKHNLYIFGHSLDITDRDILSDLILNDNIYTTIFYVNKYVMGQQIANLVKVIGQDELIKRTGGSTKTITFKQQQDMTKIK